MRQQLLFPHVTQTPPVQGRPFQMQLLKWVGNKQRFAEQIIACFPSDYRTYIEPFLGSGAVLGTLAPQQAIAADACIPLMGIWHMLQNDPNRLATSYEARWLRYMNNAQATYEEVKAQFNATQSPEDLFFLCRSCYGGIIRFSKRGYMSTPIGPHKPMLPNSISKRVNMWHERTRKVAFYCQGFEATFEMARKGDLVYCDPPYKDTQSILYGAQTFRLESLYGAIAQAKKRGVYVALSIDGQKKSGQKRIDVNLPAGVFETEYAINCGPSMLRRLQVAVEHLESEMVSDRLLLTWSP